MVVFFTGLIQVFINLNKLNKMKKIKLTGIIVCFCVVRIVAQMQPCPNNGTNTNPFNTSTGSPWASPTSTNPSPYPYFGFQTNTFDWTQPIWPVWYREATNPTLLAGTAQSPFYSSGLYYPFSKSASSDFQPKDGWELIKQDMGYFYDASVTPALPAWQGGAMGYYPILPGDNRKNGSEINYFVLFNKYSGIIRIMGQIPNPTSQSTIYVKMRFLTPNDYLGAGDPYQPNVNALFNHYNPSTYLTQALDQPTYVTEISAPAAFPSSGEMFYADFQMAYDPCVCLFQSGFEVDFSSITTANINLTGTYAGVSNIPLASINSNLGTVGGNDFIASVFDNGGSPQATIQSAIQNYNQASNVSNGIVQNGLSALATLLGIGSDLGEAFGTISSGGIPVVTSAGVTSAVNTILSNASSTQVKDGLDAASKVASFFSGIAGQVNSSPPPAALTVESGYLQASGTITYDPSVYHGINFRVGVPGSKDAGTLPEYAPANSYGDVLPNYPMYNEQMGLFALLKTPSVRQYYKAPSQSNWGQINFARDYNNASFPPNYTTSCPCDPSDYGYYNCQFYYGDKPSIPAGYPGSGYYYSQATEHDFNITNPDYFTIEYHVDEDLVYAFSPLVDITNSKVYVALEIGGKPAGAATKGTFTYKSSEGFESGLLSSTDYDRKRTPTYPIGCITNIYTKEQYNYQQNYKIGIDQDQNYAPSLAYYQSNTGNGTYEVTDASVGEVTSFYNNSDLSLVGFGSKATLVVMLDLITNPDIYGNVHRTTQIIKYLCDIHGSNTDFAATTAGSTDLSAFSNAPTNLNIVATTYTSPKDIFSFGKITITGGQTDNAPSNGVVNIAAEAEIDVTGNVSFSGNINLYTQSLPNALVATCENNALSPLNGTSLSNYCTNSGGYGAANGYSYQANTIRAGAPTTNNTKGSPSALAAKPTMVQTKLGTDIKLGIFPNPTSGVVYLNLSAQNAGNLIVNLSDATGSVVMHTSYPANVGANSYKLDLSVLNSGVYFLNVTDENGNTIKNDKIVLLGQ